jgi:hypothetical protein
MKGELIMSKMVKKVKEQRQKESTKAVENFMGGISYKLNPLDTLKMVSASSIFGEPQYYRSGQFAEKGVRDGSFWLNSVFKAYSILPKAFDGKNTSEIMESVIDDALDYDFKATLEWALELRNDYFMRLNPQVIMVRAAIHPKRAEFTQKYPSLFSEINNKVMSRADEPSSQLTYYLFINGSKSKVPNILKRSWAKRIEQMSDYDIYKYRNKGIGLIDTVRVCHANNEKINELMRTGTIEMPVKNKTWETLRASGKSWMEILQTVKVHHMALLRNLRGIFTEIEDLDFCKKVLEDLKAGVLRGKQFPFRYYTAMSAIKNSNVNHKGIILDALEECIDIACDNMPKLKGKTMCLSDNSGSAWGSFNSEYGSVTVAEIDNLSSVITARNSDEGYVGKFGDELKTVPVSKRNGVLTQSEIISGSRSSDVGGATENGIWLFFDNAIRNKEHWDNIFIYSDQQAGHGGLYGINPKEYSDYTVRGNYIDVAKLIDIYRKTVNPKVNVFSVQTAGYDNVVIPEMGYRTDILYGWTGKELVYADAKIKLWDEIESRQKNQ